jgi:hypothetical protein
MSRTAEQARLPVVGFEIAGDPTAAVEKHHRRRLVTRGPVDPRRKRTGRALHAGILHDRDGWRRNGGACRGEAPERFARALRRHAIGIAQRQQRNDLGNDGIERLDHAGSPGAGKSRPA